MSILNSIRCAPISLEFNAKTNVLREDLVMHRSKRLAILLALSLFMGSTVGTSAMAAETAEEVTNVVSEEDTSSEVSEEDTSPAILENESAVKETAIVEETVIAVHEDKEEETEPDQEAASDNGESAGYNGDTKDVQDETKDEENPEEADLDYQYETGKELLTDETTVEYEADTQVIINEAKSSFSDDQSIGEDYTNATEISVNDELNTYLNYNYAYFKFTPEKDGIYNFSVDVYGPMSVTIWLYDDELNLLAKSSDYRYEIADRLEASKTYYYEVYSAGNCKIQLKETTFFANTAQSYFKPDFGEEITLSINAYSDKPIEYVKNRFEYSYIPIPLTEEGGYFMDSPSIEFSVNKDCKDLDMTNEFMRFLVSKSELNAMASLKRLVTPTKELTFDPVYAPFAKIPSSRTFSPEVLGIKDQLTVQIRNAAFKVGKGQMTIDEAVNSYGTIE